MAETTTIEKRENRNDKPERVRSGRTYVPAVDIIEKPDELLLLADMPGATAKDIDIQYENGLLSLHAKLEVRQAPSRTNYLRQEYGVGDFSRSFQIGEGIDASRIEAECRDGVLTLHLPKTEDLKPRKIRVKGA